MVLRSFIFLGFFLLVDLFGVIGFSRTFMEDNVRHREIPLVMWYPTQEKEGISTYGGNSAFVGFSAIEEADISSNKYPIIILIHGTGGNWRNLSWMAEELAQKAIVIAASHPDYTTGQASPKTVLRPLNQAKDVHFMIDTMQEEYKEYLDGKIFVIGHSLGGYSALALAGAQLNIKKLQEFCKTHQDRSCEYFQKELSTINEKDEAKENLKDERITKIISIAPGYIPAIEEETLRNVQTPTLLVVAENDQNVPFENQIQPYEQYFSKKIHILKQEGGHFSFLQICKKDAKELLGDDSFVCEDGKTKKNRKLLHQQLLIEINKFLDD